MSDLAAGILLVLGSLTMVLGALALLRFPDLHTRLAATSKASTVGALTLLVGLVVHDPSGETVRAALLLAGFLLATVPLGGHVMARSAYARGRRARVAEGGDALAERLDEGGQDSLS